MANIGDIVTCVSLKSKISKDKASWLSIGKRYKIENIEKVGGDVFFCVISDINHYGTIKYHRSHFLDIKEERKTKLENLSKKISF